MSTFFSLFWSILIVLSIFTINPIKAFLTLYKLENEIMLMSPLTVSTFPLSAPLSSLLAHPLLESCLLTDPIDTDILLDGVNELILSCLYKSDFMVSMETRKKDSFLPARALYKDTNKSKNKKFLVTKKKSKSGWSEYPSTLLSISDDSYTSDLYWAKSYVSHHFGPLPTYPIYTGINQDTGLYSLSTGQELSVNESQLLVFKYDQGNKKEKDEIKISLAGDWGSGTRESQWVADLMMSTHQPHWTIHIGDVYYVGSEDEIQANCLGIPPANVEKGVTWPMGSLGSFALLGNHEMLSRGYGYFQTWLPQLGPLFNNNNNNNNNKKGKGQRASYFVLENQWWRLISLDTSFTTYSIWNPDGNRQNPLRLEIIQWLTHVVHLNNTNDTRGLIFLTHHQYQTAFDIPYLATPLQLSELIPRNRTVLWLWGHEHKFAMYDPLTTYENITLKAYGRCIGNGGYPVELSFHNTNNSNLPYHARASNLVLYDNRIYTTLQGITNISIGYNGFTTLSLLQETAYLEYLTLSLTSNNNTSTSNLLVREAFQVDKMGNVQQTFLDVINPNVTRVNHF